MSAFDVILQLVTVLSRISKTWHDSWDPHLQPQRPGPEMCCAIQPLKELQARNAATLLLKEEQETTTQPFQ